MCRDWDAGYMSHLRGASNQYVGSTFDVWSFHTVSVVDDLVCCVISMGHRFNVVAGIMGPKHGHLT